jgi:hypothetical protein
VASGVLIEYSDEKASIFVMPISIVRSERQLGPADFIACSPQEKYGKITAYIFSPKFNSYE